MVEKVYMVAKMVGAPVLLLFLSFVLSGCSAFRTPAELTYVSGRMVESLSGTVSLSYTAPGRSVSGNGYLMYRRPDQLRMVVLSPFGSVLQEVYLSGKMITIIDSGNGIAFSGSFMELPDKGDFSYWRYVYWLIDIDRPDSSRNSAVIQRTNRFGQQENATFENGLLVSKTTVEGGDVTYRRFASVQGTAFPLEITYDSKTKEKCTILLEDPEINVPFSDAAFSPDLNKLRVYPLSSLK